MDVKFRKTMIMVLKFYNVDIELAICIPNTRWWCGHPRSDCVVRLMSCYEYLIQILEG